MNRHQAPNKFPSEQYINRNHQSVSHTEMGHVTNRSNENQQRGTHINPSQSLIINKVCWPASESIRVEVASHSSAYISLDAAAKSTLDSRNANNIIRDMQALSLGSNANVLQKQNMAEGTAVVCECCGATRDPNSSVCPRCPSKRDPEQITLPNTLENTITDQFKGSIPQQMSSPMTTIQYGPYIEEYPEVERKLNASSSQSKSCGRGRTKSNEKAIRVINLRFEKEAPAKSNSMTDGMNYSGNIPCYAKELNITSDMAQEEVSDGRLAEKGCRSHSIKCHSIRIGSYNVSTGRVGFTEEGVKIVVPLLQNGIENDQVSIIIPIEHVVKLLYHFGNSLRVMYFNIKPSAAGVIRKDLRMSGRHGQYFDPCSSEKSHRLIMLLFDNSGEDVQSFICRIISVFENKGKKSVILGLDWKRANELLFPSSPSESCTKDEIVRERKSTRKVRTKSYEKPITVINLCSSSEEEEEEVRSSHPESSNELEQCTELLIYPFPPKKGSLSISRNDYICLEEGRYLNDAIMDFYLRYLHNNLSSMDKERTHIFPAYFYSRLTDTRQGSRRATEDSAYLTAAEKRHAGVQKWTKNVNIFQKDFLLVPINEHSHWYLAIICFPGLEGPVRFKDNCPIKDTRTEIITNKWNEVRKVVPARDSTLSGELKKQQNNESLRRQFAEKANDVGPWIEKQMDAVAAVEMRMHGSRRRQSGRDDDEEYPIRNTTAGMYRDEFSPTRKPKVEKEKNEEIPIKQPCILIFDSLSGYSNRTRIVTTLHDYLSVEYELKYKVKKAFNSDTMEGAFPKVPQQMNGYDCGIFTLQFAQSFFKSPLETYHLPIPILRDWFTQDLISTKRGEIAYLIRGLMDVYEPNNSITLPDIRLRTMMSREKQAVPEVDWITKSIIYFKQNYGQYLPFGNSNSGSTKDSAFGNTDL